MIELYETGNSHKKKIGRLFCTEKGRIQPLQPARFLVEVICGLDLWLRHYIFLSTLALLQLLFSSFPLTSSHSYSSWAILVHMERYKYSCPSPTVSSLIFSQTHLPYLSSPVLPLLLSHTPSTLLIHFRDFAERYLPSSPPPRFPLLFF